MWPVISPYPLPWLTQWVFEDATAQTASHQNCIKKTPSLSNTVLRYTRNVVYILFLICLYSWWLARGLFVYPLPDFIGALTLVQDFDRRRVPTRGMDDVLLADTLKAKLDKVPSTLRSYFVSQLVSIFDRLQVVADNYYHVAHPASITSATGTVVSVEHRWCNTRKRVQCSWGNGASGPKANWWAQLVCFMVLQVRYSC